MKSVAKVGVALYTQTRPYPCVGALMCIKDFSGQDLTVFM